MFRILFRKLNNKAKGKTSNKKQPNFNYVYDFRNPQTILEMFFHILVVMPTGAEETGRLRHKSRDKSSSRHGVWNVSSSEDEAYTA